ncbi:MAG: hypothetical protein GXY23_06765 [Myxococcales bacterium]|nr:hypothetical protein [Myxococcales bacterium]
MFALGGCPVWNDGLDGERPYEECVTHGDCPEGRVCVAGIGECRDTATCDHDAHCRANERCDARGTCVPRDGDECTGDAQCGLDERCVANRCKSEDSVCQFDWQCGVDAGGNALVCVNNECTRPCAEDAECGSGQKCEGHVCVRDRDQCRLTKDCPSGLHCVDGACLPGCTLDAHCPQDEVCEAGFCVPDTSPKPFCQDESDCAEGRLCVDGACRTPCPEAPATCQHFDFQFTVCNEETGLCEAPNESIAECFGAADCPAGKSCVDGLCR